MSRFFLHLSKYFCIFIPLSLPLSQIKCRVSSLSEPHLLSSWFVSCHLFNNLAPLIIPFCTSLELLSNHSLLLCLQLCICLSILHFFKKISFNPVWYGNIFNVISLFLYTPWPFLHLISKCVLCLFLQRRNAVTILKQKNRWNS